MRKIPISRGKFVIVDDEDYEELVGHSWHYHYNKAGNEYARRNSDNRYMHRVILGLTKRNQLVDHINHNGLDNRKKNLRVCSTHQNVWHRRKRKVGLYGKGKPTSKYIGVTWNKKRGCWDVHIRCMGVREYLGSFESEEAAGVAYNQRVVQLYEDFAVLNAV